MCLPAGQYTTCPSMYTCIIFHVLQVCNAVYLRLNFSTPLCACPEPGDPCSASTLASDNHSLRYLDENETFLGKLFIYILCVAD